MIATSRGIIILLIAITVSVAGVLFYENKKAQEDALPSVLFPAIALTSKEAAHPSPEEPFNPQAWLPYDNKDLSFQVKYPNGWSVGEYQQDPANYKRVFINPLRSSEPPFSGVLVQVASGKSFTKDERLAFGNADPSRALKETKGELSGQRTYTIERPYGRVDVFVETTGATYIISLFPGDNSLTRSEFDYLVSSLSFPE